MSRTVAGGGGRGSSRIQRRPPMIDDSRRRAWTGLVPATPTIHEENRVERHPTGATLFGIFFIGILAMDALLAHHHSPRVIVVALSFIYAMYLCGAGHIRELDEPTREGVQALAHAGPVRRPAPYRRRGSTSTRKRPCADAD